MGTKMPVIFESANVLKPDFDFATLFCIDNFGFCNVAQSAQPNGSNGLLLWSEVHVDKDFAWVPKLSYLVIVQGSTIIRTFDGGRPPGRERWNWFFIRSLIMAGVTFWALTENMAFFRIPATVQNWRRRVFVLHRSS